MLELSTAEKKHRNVLRNVLSSEYFFFAQSKVYGFFLCERYPISIELIVYDKTTTLVPLEFMNGVPSSGRLLLRSVGFQAQTVVVG